MNIKGITLVILMMGTMGIVSIIGMVAIAIVHDGDLSTGVISNLEAIAVGAVGVAGTLIAHYIGAGAAQQQLQTQASIPPTATVPVTVTASPSPATPVAETTSSGG